jgi:hypothetical protein
MEADTRFGKVMSIVLGAILCAGVLLAPVAGAADRPFKVSYAGVGYDSPVDPNSDTLPVTYTDAAAQGSFGASEIAITAEFSPVPPAGLACRTGFTALGVRHSSVVLTFKDQSQLFGWSTGGWMCVDRVGGYYYGQAQGVYIGGAGRFAKATGTWVSDFDGQNLDPPTFGGIGFRSIRGTVDGTVKF